VLLVTMHHIISDGWSIKILIREIGELYEAYAERARRRASRLTPPIRGLRVWQRGWLQGERLEEPTLLLEKRNWPMLRRFRITNR
jgi:hypothetical protein